MPHGFCLQWNPQLVGLMVVSNLLIALSYYSIPSNLVFIAIKKKVRFGWLLIMFAAFIVLCGTTHIMSIVTIWHGSYWLEAIVNAMTAAISLITAVALWILVPQVFAALETDVAKRVTSGDNSKARTQMIASLVLGMLLIVFVGGLAYEQCLGLISSRTDVTRSQEVVTAVYDLKSALDEAQTNQRGYLLTGNEQDLNSFEKQIELVATNLDGLSNSTEDDASRKEQMVLLRQEITGQVAQLKEMNRVRKDRGADAALTAYATGAATNDSKKISDAFQKILKDEERVSQATAVDLESRTQTFLFTFVVLAILAIALFCSSGYFMSKYLTDVSVANAAVRKSEELLRLTFGSVKDFAIINLDTAGKVIGWNSAAQHLHGYEEREILGKNFSSLYTEPIAIGETNGDRENVTRQGRHEEERWQLRKDGSKFWAEVAISPIYDETKNWTGFVQVTRDITERRKAQDEIREQADQLTALAQKLVASNQDLQQFAYVASHDLQEPLRTISSFCELLEKKTKGKLDPDSLKYLGVIVQGTTRMQRLIKDLLQCAKIDTQGKPLVNTDLNQVLEESLDGLKVAINESEAEISYDKMPSVLGDESQLSMLFQNLIGNAIKFKGENAPKVHVSAEPDGDRFRISVRDNGIGIDSEYAERIFVIFQRLHARTKYEGSGIGLAVCKRIVERHGGTISVKSTAGGGSDFVFTLQRGATGV